MPLMADYFVIFFKCVLTFLVALDLFCSTANARVLGSSQSASLTSSTLPGNTTDITSSKTFTDNAAPDELSPWLSLTQHLWRRAGSPHKQPNPATDAQFTDAAARGCNLLYMMAANADDALKRMQTNPKLKTMTSSQSKWTNAGDLKTYGWEDKKGDVNWGYAGVNAVMKDLNIDISDTKVNSNIQLLQNADVTVEGKKYLKSNGVYNQNMNTAAGLIMPYYIYSPAHEGNRLNVPGPYVPLAQYSDVSFLYWSKLCGRTGGQVCNLKHFLFINIENPDTWAIVLKALQNVNGNIKLKAWGGTEFSMNTSEGKAILSTQIGRTLAWFLIQHKAQLGASKVVTRAKVFLNTSATNRDTDVPYPSILFYVEDGPADTHCDPVDQCCCPNLEQAGDW